MSASKKMTVRIRSVLGVLIFTLIIFTTFSSAQEIEFKDVKKKGILKDKVIDTANIYADVLQFDAKSKVKDILITETINILVPKGQMTPREIMLETTVKENYVVIPQQPRTFSGRKHLYWAWSVRAIGSDNKTGMTSERGFYVREFGK